MRAAEGPTTHAIECVLTSAGGERKNRQRRILTSLGREARPVGHVKPACIPTLIVGVQNRTSWIGAHPRGAALVDRATRRTRHFIYSCYCHFGKLGKLPQRLGLLARTGQFRFAMAAIDAQYWNTPRVSPISCQVLLGFPAAEAFPQM